MSKNRQQSSVLMLMRSWSRRAWMIHAILLASLILGPHPLGHAVPVLSYDVLDENDEVIETRQYEDWNDNQTRDGNENTWIYDSQDSDEDGLVDAREVVWGTDYNNPDSDYDGITDGNEVDLFGGTAAGFDPTNWDSNSNGYSDHDEAYGYYGVNYSIEGLGHSYYDWDGDGYKNPEDTHPLDSALYEDWDNNGTNDPDEMYIDTDSDGDGYYDYNDSHPMDANLWSDWNGNGINEEDEFLYDWDEDGYLNDDDSHPNNSDLWNDWNDNGFNDEIEGEDSDADSYGDNVDSHPFDPYLWQDWNDNGINDGDEDQEEDTDGDGYSDSVDSHPSEELLWSDWDGDGLNEEEEVVLGTYPFIYDSDDDGLSDGEEVTYGTNALNIDTDNDGLTDYDELVIYAGSIFGQYLDPTNPHSISSVYLDYLMVDATDTDGDGIPDAIESFYAPSMNPEDPSDALGDLDADYITNLQEYQNGTLFNGNLKVYDYDRDGITDIEEDFWRTQLIGTYPNGILNKFWFDDSVQDPDGDGVLNFEEIRLGLNPGNAMTHEGTGDLAWANTTQGTSWTASITAGDTDGDGLPDLWEHRYWLDVRDAGNTSADPDTDTLTNFYEYLTWRNPRIFDFQSSASSPVVPSDLTGGQSVNQPFEPSIPVGLNEGTTQNFSFLDGSITTGGYSLQPRFMISRLQWKKVDSPRPPHDHYRAGTRVYANSTDYSNCDLPDIDAWTWLDTHSAPSYQPCQHGTADRCWADYYEEDENGDGVIDPNEIHAGWGFNISVPCEFNNPDLAKCGSASMQMEINSNLPDGADPIVRHAHVTITEADGSSSDSYLPMIISPGDRVSSPVTIDVVEGRKVKIECDTSATNNQSVSLSDGAGSRYRKVGLNGFPLSDSKPQVQNENGEENEETYIDAFSSQLRHSVSDVYVSEPASLIPLSVKRDLTSDSWNLRSGLRGNERADQPFGPCWTSNICSYVRFEDIGKAEVVDEMGARQTYFLFDHAAYGYGGTWVHSREDYRDQKTRNNELITSATVPEPVQITGTNIYFRSYDDIVLKKKFGTICTYEMINPNDLHQLFSNDRQDGSSDSVGYSYARLTKVEDRWGNTLIYDYPDSRSLVPSSIYDPARDGHSISIEQEDGRITRIREPNGGIIEYEYENSPAHNVAIGVGLNTVVPQIPMLRRVKRGNVDEGGGSVVQYTYEQRLDKDMDDSSGSMVVTTHIHTELADIVDERGNDYHFEYAFNRAIYSFGSSGLKMSYGLPLLLSRVTSPLGGVLEISTDRSIIPGNAVLDPNEEPEDLNNDGVISLGEFYTLSAAPDFTTSFNWKEAIGEAASRSFSYNFSDAALLQPTAHDLQAVDGLRAYSTATTAVYSFKTMTLTAPDGGVETYKFDPDHSMALKEITDRNNYKTTFGYNPPDVDFYDDPISEKNHLNHTKHMTYDENTRILSGVKTARGVSTTYEIDSIGRRTQEVVKDLSSSSPLPGGAKKVWTFGHALFPGFATQETVDTLAARGANDPSLADCPVVTTSWRTESDTNKVGWWRMITASQTFNNSANSVTSETLTISDFNGNKRSVTDGRGHTTSFEYDAQNRLIQVTYPDGTFKAMAYDAHGNMIREQDEMGAVTFHQYDELNRRVKTTFDLNQNGLEDTRYNEVNLDPIGMPTYNGDLVTETTYNSLNLPVTVVDSRGVVTKNDYDVMGRLIKTTVNDAAANDSAKLITEYFYKLAGVNGGKEAGSTAFDTSGFKPVKVIDPRGYATQFEYDAVYRLTKEVRSDNSVVLKTYNKGGQVTSVSDPGALAWSPTNVTISGYEEKVLPQGTGGDNSPYVTYMVYDALGQAIRTNYPDGKSAQSFYTPSGSVWKTIDETGAVTLNKFDAAGHSIQVTLDEVEDKKGGQTNVLGNPTSRTVYDAAGNPVKVWDAYNRMTQTVFDVRNRPTATIAPPVVDYGSVGLAVRSPVSLTAYDAAGRVIQTTNPLGYETRSFYDAAGRAVCSINALDQKNLMTYDAGGNVLTTSRVDPGFSTGPFQTVTNDYDSLGRLIKTTDAESQVNYFAYDKGGNRILVIDGRATVNDWPESDAFAWAADWDVGPAVPFSPYHTTFRYDSFNRLQEQTFANGDHWSYEYNLTGTLKQKTDPKGQTTTYTYDSRQRPDITAGPGGITLKSDRAYDTAGRLREVKDTSMELLPATPTDLEVATCSYTYDKLGRTSTETSYGRTHTYGYDLAGNKVVSLLKVQGDRERLLLQSYDAHNRLTSMVDDNRTNTTGDDKSTEYGYDLAGRVLLMKTSNGNTDVSATVNTYDALGSLKTRKLYKTHSLISTNLLVSFTQSYDAFGNVVSQFETWMKSNGTVDRTRNTTMTYDQANRLKTEVIQDSGYAAVVTIYVYDGASNRTGKTVYLGSGTAPSGVELGYWTYTYNDANQLVRTDKRQSSSGSIISGATYTYDANGNRISQLVDGTTAVAARTTTYGWDAWDRLREVKVPTTATAQKTYRYSYDYRMRRIAMAQTGGGLTTRHTAVLYSGGLSVAEYNRSNNNTITNSTLSSMQYVRGPDMGGGVGGLLYTFRRSGDSLVQRFNLSNGRGDIVAQTSTTGALTWTASYEAYGKQTKETGTNNDRQRANSKEEDPTGLLNEGFRYRDLETGVWLSRDPAGFVDGPNLYAYVQQNPWSKFDAEGLFWSAIITAGFAAYDTYQYATGQISGAEYAGAMALNGAALVADLATAGQGGGLAVRAANAAIKVAKAVDKVNNIVETAQATVEATQDIVAAIENGDGRGLARTVGGALLDAATDKVLGKKARGKGDFRGGPHKKTSKPANDGKESHHMPAKEVSGLGEQQGPAIQMDPKDHAETMSHGSKQGSGEYREMIGDIIANGDMRGAMATEMRDVRRVARQAGAPSKYNEAMREMMDYSRSKGFIPKNPQTKVERTK